MNKYIYMFAAAGLVLAGCSNNDVRNDIADNEVEIGFNAISEKITKAEIKDEDDLAKEGGFVVWGYKANTAAADWTTDLYAVFDKVDVTPKVAGEGSYNAPGANTDQTAWTYADKKYWDKNATYAFYAVAPLQPAGVTYSISSDSANAKKISITPVSYGLASAAATYDYLIDRDGNIGRNGATDVWKNVDFDFHHIMTKVDFKVKKSTDVSQTLTITELKMTGWSNGTGSFTQTLTTTPGTLSNDEWTTKPTDKAGNVTLIGTGRGNETVALANTDAVALTDVYLMVPQDIAASTLKFTVTYKIGDEEFKDQEATITAAQTWGTDSHITYTVTVGPKAIEFDVETICGFDSPSPTAQNGSAATN